MLKEKRIGEAGRLGGGRWARSCWPGLAVCRGHYGGARPDMGRTWHGAAPGLLPNPPPSLDINWGRRA
ncbi:hypothetical protein NDU88_004371 [Pleurodeles waltl]|uniref:Uncharacterized protein n=1 Tax=Pleurodeles waltl TaxID=8319 RepID=A0AAV7NM20_PLEWA|nr:hypothetical protein NDU88_004371 [Pleurodeles waltl]